MNNIFRSVSATTLCRSPYWALTKYVAPLTLTLLAIDIGEQALYRSLAGSVTSVKSLAAFGIAYIIVKLTNGFISEVKVVSLVLVHNNSHRRKIMLCLTMAGLLVCIVNLLIGLTDLGYYLIDKLHEVPPDVGSEARVAILYLSAFPLIDGLAWLHTGILLKYKFSVTVGCASIIDNVFQVLVVVILLKTNLPKANVIIIPVLATYSGAVARLVTVLVAYFKCVHLKLNSAVSSNHPFSEDNERTLTFRRIAALWTPLGLVQICQRICRPIVNLFVARDRSNGMTRNQAVEAVAVLSVCYPVGHFPYGWLNTLRLIEPAFKKKRLENETKVTLKNIRIFNFFCFTLSAMFMVILFWIPGVSFAILTNVSHVTQDIARSGVKVLQIFSFFPIPVANRANLTGMFVSEEQSKYLFPSVPTRIVVLISSLFILPLTGLQGAMMGVAALFSAFVGESLCLLIMSIIFRYRRIVANNEASLSSLEEETVL